MRYIANGESLVKTADQTVSGIHVLSDTANIITAKALTLTGALMQPSDVCSVYLKRLQSDGKDDRNGDTALAGISFNYTANKL